MDSTVTADLHIHSTCSDGTLTPAEIVAQASAAGLRYIALCDHDSIAGVAEAIASVRPGMTVIPACEMSARAGGQDIHILAYYIDIERAELIEYLEGFRDYRLKRARRIVKKLARDGIRLDFEQLRHFSRNSALGRPHIAQALLEGGYVRSINEAFIRYLGYHAPYYEPKKDVPPRDVINKIVHCGGVPVLAHPAATGNEVARRFIGEGVAGLEVWHPDHSQRQVRELFALAVKNGLVTTGGSDFHGFCPGRVRIGCCGCRAEDVRALQRRRIS